MLRSILRLQSNTTRIRSWGRGGGGQATRPFITDRVLCRVRVGTATAAAAAAAAAVRPKPCVSSCCPADSRAGEGSPRTVDHAVIGGVVAVVVFAMLCLLIVLGRYFARHKGKASSFYSTCIARPDTTHGERCLG